MEWASHEDPLIPGRKANWINEAQAVFQQPGWEQFTTLLYYDRSQKPTCNFWINSSVSSAGALAAMGSDPFYGRFDGGPTDTTPPSIPGQPTGLSDAPGTVSLTWSASTDDLATTLTYRIYRDGGLTPVGSVASASTGTVSFTDSGLAGGTGHVYEVAASDGPNTSARSQASDPVIVEAQTSIFADGFDDGFSNWTSVSGLTIDPASGSPAVPSVRAETSASRAWASKLLGNDYASICASQRVNLTSTIGGASLLRLRTAADAPIIRTLITSGRVLSVRSDVAGVQVSTGVTLQTGTWTTIELCGTVGESGSWTLYRDGGLILGPWTANTGTVPVGRVTIGTPDARTIAVNFDDMILDLTPG